MNHSLVMTILATDRKGLVRAIASIVNEHKGNWQESSMARLSGQFAGILRVDCPATEIVEKELLPLVIVPGFQLLPTLFHTSDCPLVGATVVVVVVVGAAVVVVVVVVVVVGAAVVVVVVGGDK